MGELELIKVFRARAPRHPWIVVGPGHDCAVLNWPAGRDQAFKIDQIVEGTHFRFDGPRAATPRDVGWKALAKACSDIAATGFWPVAATVAVNFKRGCGDQVALEIFEGLSACCERFSIGLAGGDVSVSENGLSIAVALLGEGPKGGAWTRAGAQTGDALLVTGALGASSTGKHLHFMPRLHEARAIREIIPGQVHASIDITDGLSRDLRHICAESGCGALLHEARIPCSDSARQRAQESGQPAAEQTLGDGEDFELLLAIAPQAAKTLLAQWKEAVPLTEIGVIQPAEAGIQWEPAGGGIKPLPDMGYEHRA